MYTVLSNILLKLMTLYYDTGWLLLTSLDKVSKEKDEFYGLNSQIKCYINHLKISICALKETLMSSNNRAKTAENQI